MSGVSAMTALGGPTRARRRVQNELRDFADIFRSVEVSEKATCIGQFQNEPVHALRMHVKESPSVRAHIIWLERGLNGPVFFLTANDVHELTQSSGPFFAEGENTTFFAIGPNADDILSKIIENENNFEPEKFDEDGYSLK